MPEKTLPSILRDSYDGVSVVACPWTNPESLYSMVNAEWGKQNLGIDSKQRVDSLVLAVTPEEELYVVLPSLHGKNGYYKIKPVRDYHKIPIQEDRLAYGLVIELLWAYAHGVDGVPVIIAQPGQKQWIEGQIKNAVQTAREKLTKYKHG